MNNINSFNSDFKKLFYLMNINKNFIHDFNNENTCESESNYSTIVQHNGEEINLNFTIKFDYGKNQEKKSCKLSKNNDELLTIVHTEERSFDIEDRISIFINNTYISNILYGEIILKVGMQDIFSKLIEKEQILVDKNKIKKEEEEISSEIKQVQLVNDLFDKLNPFKRKM